MLRSQRRRDDAFSLIELNIASAISVLLLVAAASVLITVLRDTTHVEARTRAQSEVSVAFDRLVVELRESATADSSGPYVATQVRELSPTRLVFTSDVSAGHEGVELVTYEVTNCAGSECALVRTIVASAGIVSGVADYGNGTQLQQVEVVTHVLHPSVGRSLFEGIDWSGGIRQVVASCDSATPAVCDFDGVEVNIIVELFVGEWRPQSFREFVRMRNHGR
jgi:hypothetical protein